MSTTKPLRAAYPTIDFGCPTALDPHFVDVTIPRGAGPVSIVEHYGLTALDAENTVERVRLGRVTWSLIAPVVALEFNARLAIKHHPPGRWKIGTTKMDRHLGRELCVLAWAVEVAPIELVPAALLNWAGLKPEERWWLYTRTAAASGGVDDAHLGWRKALRYALTENHTR